MKFSSLTLSVLFIATGGFGASLGAGTLVSGPMLGYQTHREVLSWVETKEASSVALNYQIAGHPESLHTLNHAHPWISLPARNPLNLYSRF